LKELDARASADLRTSIPTEPVIEAMMARKTNTEYAGRLFVNIAIGSENPSPIIRPGEYVYSVESDEANTYSEGEIGSQLTESALSDSADAFSSHRSPMVKKKPTKKSGIPPKIIATRDWTSKFGITFRKDSVAT